jgi:O-antigen ligase
VISHGGGEAVRGELTERLAEWGLMLLPGALVVYLGFNAGGFFPGTPALVAVALLLILAARMLVAERPFAGFSGPLAVAAGALALYAVWTLISATWSDSTWRALVEFDRTLLYLAALVLFGSIPRQGRRVRWMTRGLALGILVVCTAGLITRVLPDVWPIAPNMAQNRLSYPLTYWNAMGLLGSIGMILCFHFACSRSEPWPIRLLGAAAVPVLATTVLFTFSRGGILAGAIGVPVYIILSRPRALLSGVMATVPTAAIAVFVAYQADKLAGSDPTSAAATSQGHHVALVVALCAVGALVIRAFLLGLDSWFGLHPEVRTGAVATVAAAAVVSVAVVSVAFDAPHYVSHEYHGFVHGGKVVNPGDERQRLSDPSSNGRMDHWRVGVRDGYDRDRLTGEGAGTYELVWAADRPKEFAGVTVHDAHSLYVESLSDLGLVGLLTLIAALLTILFGFAARFGGQYRSLYAALGAAALAWALHAGVDWDWEMPVLTLWVFMLGGAALAAPRRRVRFRASPSLPIRAGLCAGLILIAVIPASVAISQGRFDHAVQTFLHDGDCPKVIREARDASSILAMRPEPYRLEGYCQARLGRTREAIDSMSKAVRRDPNEWQYRFALSVVRAAAGEDPRPAARQARRLDPREPLTNGLVLVLSTPDRRVWRKQGRVLLRAPIF